MKIFLFAWYFLINFLYKIGLGSNAYMVGLLNILQKNSIDWPLLAPTSNKAQLMNPNVSQSYVG